MTLLLPRMIWRGSFSTATPNGISGGTEGVGGCYSIPDEIYDLIHKCERLSDGGTP